MKFWEQWLVNLDRVQFVLLPALDIGLVLLLTYMVLVIIGERRTLWMVRGLIFLMLAAALSKSFPDQNWRVPDLMQRLRTHPADIAAMVSAALEQAGAAVQLLLFVDQFEEVFTSKVEDAARSNFFKLQDTGSGGLISNPHLLSLSIGALLIVD